MGTATPCARPTASSDSFRPVHRPSPGCASSAAPSPRRFASSCPSCLPATRSSPRSASAARPTPPPRPRPPTAAPAAPPPSVGAPPPPLAPRPLVTAPVGTARSGRLPPPRPSTRPSPFCPPRSPPPSPASTSKRAPPRARACACSAPRSTPSPRCAVRRARTKASSPSLRLLSRSPPTSRACVRVRCAGLSLAHGGLKGSDLTPLFSLLQGGPGTPPCALRRLSLRDNRLADVGCKALCEALCAGARAGTCLLEQLDVAANRNATPWPRSPDCAADHSSACPVAHLASSAASSPPRAVRQS